MNEILRELERIVDGSRPRAGAFERLERRVRRHRMRERLFAGAIAAAVVAGTALAYLQLPHAGPTATTTGPARTRVDGVYETRIRAADLHAPSSDFSAGADFLRLGTGRLRLVLHRGVYQLIFYQDRWGPLYLRNQGTYRLEGSRLVLTSHSSFRPGPEHGPSVVVLTWSLSGDLLGLEPISASERWPEDRRVANVMFGAHPWHRVG